ncbi:NAD(P)/FAD-dependent oxidoreductase [Paenibacillus daejeonensis]|uniref:NAD(P)/FAD-dependent oxidoreductase n=1 Tax=Paenibacillus daejeonensis TaxID=135193 RepID=UPI0003782ACD|nr:NAD(P)/FAD-dependent oxidoreductase [Paenibacillus daejeonensis]
MPTYDCLIVGAGPAGIGMGSVLQDLGVRHFSILERADIGASFAMWPREVRMITPSFTSNAYGMMDLNAIALNTSPAYTLGTEHPSGEDYANYLHAVAAYKQLPVQCGIDVTGIEPVDSGGFEVQTQAGKLTAQTVIWAAGEFQYPDLGSFPGAEYGIHNSLVQEWKHIEGDDIVIVGGYESGADAAIHLAHLGKHVTIIDRKGHGLKKGSSDPSVELSPYTKDRLRQVEEGRIDWIGGYEVQWIEADEHERYLIYCEDAEGQSRMITTMAQPILATGFKGSLGIIESLFARDEQGKTRLTESDESTVTPGLFLTGPSVIHGQLLFCFIYKFRQRFGVIGDAIARRFELDRKILETYHKEGLLLDDLSCCGETCTC